MRQVTKYTDAIKAKVTEFLNSVAGLDNIQIQAPNQGKYYLGLGPAL